MEDRKVGHPAVLISYVVIICPCLVISFSASAASSVSLFLKLSARAIKKGRSASLQILRKPEKSPLKRNGLRPSAGHFFPSTIASSTSTMRSSDSSAMYSYTPWKLQPPVGRLGQGMPMKLIVAPSVPPRMGV